MACSRFKANAPEFRPSFAFAAGYGGPLVPRPCSLPSRDDDGEGVSSSVGAPPSARLQPRVVTSRGLSFKTLQQKLGETQKRKAAAAAAAAEAEASLAPAQTAGRPAKPSVSSVPYYLYGRVAEVDEESPAKADGGCEDVLEGGTWNPAIATTVSSLPGTFHAPALSVILDHSTRRNTLHALLLHDVAMQRLVACPGRSDKHTRALCALSCAAAGSGHRTTLLSGAHCGVGSHEWKAALLARDRAGYRALHAAVTSGDAAATEFLLSRGCDVNWPTDPGSWSPLALALVHCRCERSGHAMVELLLSRGADPLKPGRWGVTPLHLAAAAAGETAAVLDASAAAGCPPLATVTAFERCVAALQSVAEAADTWLALAHTASAASGRWRVQGQARQPIARGRILPVASSRSPAIRTALAYVSPGDGVADVPSVPPPCNAPDAFGLPPVTYALAAWQACFPGTGLRATEHLQSVVSLLLTHGAAVCEGFTHPPAPPTSSPAAASLALPMGCNTVAAPPAAAASAPLLVGALKPAAVLASLCETVSPLHAAARVGDAACVATLVSAAAEHSSATVLGRPGVAASAITAGAALHAAGLLCCSDPNDPHGDTVLHAAIRCGNLSVVASLLAATSPGAAADGHPISLLANAPNAMGSRPLQLAAAVSFDGLANASATDDSESVMRLLDAPAAGAASPERALALPSWQHRLIPFLVPAVLRRLRGGAADYCPRCSEAGVAAGAAPSAAPATQINGDSLAAGLTAALVQSGGDANTYAAPAVAATGAPAASAGLTAAGIRGGLGSASSWSPLALALRRGRLQTACALLLAGAVLDENAVAVLPHVAPGSTAADGAAPSRGLGDVEQALLALPQAPLAPVSLSVVTTACTHQPSLAAALTRCLPGCVLRPGSPGEAATLRALRRRTALEAAIAASVSSSADRDRMTGVAVDVAAAGEVAVEGAAVEEVAAGGNELPGAKGLLEVLGLGRCDPAAQARLSISGLSANLLGGVGADVVLTLRSGMAAVSDLEAADLSALGWRRFSAFCEHVFAIEGAAETAAQQPFCSAQGAPLRPTLACHSPLLSGRFPVLGMLMSRSAGAGGTGDLLTPLHVDVPSVAAAALLLVWAATGSLPRLSLRQEATGTIGAACLVTYRSELLQGLAEATEGADAASLAWLELPLPLPVLLLLDALVLADAWGAGLACTASIAGALADLLRTAMVRRQVAAGTGLASASDLTCDSDDDAEDEALSFAASSDDDIPLHSSPSGMIGSAAGAVGAPWGPSHLSAAAAPEALHALLALLAPGHQLSQQPFAAVTLASGSAGTEGGGGDDTAERAARRALARLRRVFGACREPLQAPQASALGLGRQASPMVDSVSAAVLGGSPAAGLPCFLQQLRHQGDATSRAICTHAQTWVGAHLRLADERTSRLSAAHPDSASQVSLSRAAGLRAALAAGLHELQASAFWQLAGDGKPRPNPLGDSAASVLSAVGISDVSTALHACGMLPDASASAAAGGATFLLPPTPACVQAATEYLESALRASYGLFHLRSIAQQHDSTLLPATAAALAAVMTLCDALACPLPIDGSRVSLLAQPTLLGRGADAPSHGPLAGAWAYFSGAAPTPEEAAKRLLAGLPCLPSDSAALLEASPMASAVADGPSGGRRLAAPVLAQLAVAMSPTSLAALAAVPRAGSRARGDEGYAAAVVALAHRVEVVFAPVQVLLARASVASAWLACVSHAQAARLHCRLASAGRVLQLPEPALAVLPAVSAWEPLRQGEGRSAHAAAGIESTPALLQASLHDMLVNASGPSTGPAPRADGCTVLPVVVPITSAIDSSTWLSRIAEVPLPCGPGPLGSALCWLVLPLLMQWPSAAPSDRSSVLLMVPALKAAVCALSPSMTGAGAQGTGSAVLLPAMQLSGCSASVVAARGAAAAGLPAPVPSALVDAYAAALLCLRDHMHGDVLAPARLASGVQADPIVVAAAQPPRGPRPDSRIVVPACLLHPCAGEPGAARAVPEAVAASRGCVDAEVCLPCFAASSTSSAEQHNDASVLPLLAAFRVFSALHSSPMASSRDRAPRPSFVGALATLSGALCRVGDSLAAALPLVEFVHGEGNACTDELARITSAALLLASQVRNTQHQHDAVPCSATAAALQPAVRLLHIVALRGLGALVPTLALDKSSSAASGSEEDVSASSSVTAFPCTREVSLVAQGSVDGGGIIGSLLTKCLARAAGH